MFTYFYPFRAFLIFHGFGLLLQVHLDVIPNVGFTMLLNLRLNKTLNLGFHVSFVSQDLQKRGPMFTQF